MKTYFFMAGLPRAGATLLQAILNQNPDIHTGPESPVCGLIDNSLRFLHGNEQQVLYPKPKFPPLLSRSIIDSYYADVDEKYIIDKCRVWASDFNRRLLWDLTSNVKIIAPVRDVLEVLASYVSIINDSKLLTFVDENLRFLGQEINDDNRCHWLMKEDGLIGMSLKTLEETYVDNEVFLIEYEELINDTDSVLYNLYEFLEIPHFQHTYEDIEYQFESKDGMLGLPDLHHVRPTIEKRINPWTEVLSNEVIQKYKGMEFWR